MREIGFAILIFLAGGFSGWSFKSCPVPKDPEPIIKEVEKIRYVDKPIITEITKNVREIIKEPFYAGDCFDAAGVQHLNNLISSTSAGRADPTMPSPGAAEERK